MNVHRRYKRESAKNHEKRKEIIRLSETPTFLYISDNNLMYDELLINYLFLSSNSYN